MHHKLPCGIQWRQEGEILHLFDPSDQAIIHIPIDELFHILPMLYRPKVN